MNNRVEPRDWKVLVEMQDHLQAAVLASHLEASDIRVNVRNFEGTPFRGIAGLSGGDLPKCRIEVLETEYAAACDAMEYFNTLDRRIPDEALVYWRATPSEIDDLIASHSPAKTAPPQVGNAMRLIGVGSLMAGLVFGIGTYLSASGLEGDREDQQRFGMILAIAAGGGLLAYGLSSRSSRKN
ncbi:MAG: hypothetical protein KDB07_12545 [Planctomycetes bacterium]|nr:hypothetical protein [Planctomycetota bacterium]